MIAPDTLKLIVTDGYELYHMHDDTDNHGNAFAVLGFREKFTIVEGANGKRTSDNQEIGGRV